MFSEVGMSSELDSKRREKGERPHNYSVYSENRSHLNVLSRENLIQETYYIGRAEKPHRGWLGKLELNKARSLDQLQHQKCVK